MRIIIISAIHLLIFSFVSTLQAKDAKDAQLAASAPTESITSPHDIWNTLLGMYVSADGVVDYKSFKRSEARLSVYLDMLSKDAPQASWSREKKMAYWINLYNASTVALILKNYPLKSITDLGKPWDQAFIKVGSKTYTLNQVEHEILRPQFQDARIHFAVNCAAISCPALLNEAYSADKLNQQLDTQTRKFINNNKHNSVSSSEVSELFKWYKEDFTKKGSVIDFLNQYAATPYKKGKTLGYKTYDWGLNEK